MSGDHFPHSPGWRASAHGETSRLAAEGQRLKAPRMLDRLTALLTEGPASPEELHAELKRQGVTAPLTSVRARVCQLHKQGRVVDSGARGLGESGSCKVIVWRLSTPDELSLHLARKAADAEHGEASHG